MCLCLCARRAGHRMAAPSLKSHDLCTLLRTSHFRCWQLVYEEFTRKLRGEKGAAARYLSEAAPARPGTSPPSAARSLRSISTAARLMGGLRGSRPGTSQSQPNLSSRLLGASASSPFLSKLPPLSPAAPRSSSRPPSEDGYDSDDPEKDFTPRRVKAAGAELASFIRSTRLQEAEAAWRQEEEARQAVAAERDAESRHWQAYVNRRIL